MQGELIRTKVLLEESEEKLAQAEGRVAEIQTQLKQKEKELKEVSPGGPQALSIHTHTHTHTLVILDRCLGC